MSVAIDTPAELEKERARRRSDGAGGGGGGEDGENGGAGRGPDGGDDDERRRAAGRMAELGIWVGIAPVLVLFLAFVSAYVVRQGLGSGWVAVDLPPLVWGNTLMLVLSSLMLERARRVLAGESASTLIGGVPPRSAAQPFLMATVALGLVFVIGQVVTWRQLHGQGIDMSTSPYSAFFYLLTGTHAVHLAGGLIGLAAAAFWPVNGFRNLNRAVAVKIASIYWHFMGVLWLGLLLLLVFRR